MERKDYSGILRKSIVASEYTKVRRHGEEPKGNDIDYDNPVELLSDIANFKHYLKRLKLRIERRRKKLEEGNFGDDPGKEEQWRLWRLKEEQLLKEDEALAESWREKIKTYRELYEEKNRARGGTVKK